MTDVLKPEDTRDALRKIGILLFGIGALMIFIRKGGDWGKFPIFLVLALPAVAFYGAGVLTEKDTGGLQPWQAVASVFGLLFVILALFQFVDLLGGSPSNLNTFWIFGVTAALAIYAGEVVGIRFQLLAAGLAIIVSWSGLWDKLLGGAGIAGHFGTYRGLLGIAAILLVLGGLHLWRQDRNKAAGLVKFSELLTAAGIAAVIGCALGVTSAFGQFSTLGTPIISDTSLWDVLLLAVSLGLVAIGAQIGVRGPVYIGAIGLFFFLIIVGNDLNDGTPDPHKLGLWPLILLILGGGAIAASLSPDVSLGNKPKELVKKISEG